MIRVVFNQKGGVGKSTITVNLAAMHSLERQTPTLVVDLDPQGNASRYLLGEQSQSTQPSLADFFEQVLNFSLYNKPTSAFVHATPFPGLHVMTAHPALQELQGKLESRYKIYKLREALAELASQFPAIYIDTPPALNFYTRSALMAADACLIPFDCDEFSRQALYQLLENAEEIRRDHNPNLKIEGIVVNQFQARASLPLQLVQGLEAEGLPVLKPYLSTSVKIRESHHQARPLAFMPEKHKLTEEYRALLHALAP